KEGTISMIQAGTAMKKKLRGLKRRDILYDFDLYRRRVPMPGVVGEGLSVVDLQPEGADQTIVFVHGYAGILESWEFQINHFARNYRVIAPDLRGHGQSDAPYTSYLMPELVADLHAIVEHLELPERFILVGHSFGGSICAEYANAHSERLEKLVLLATAGEYPLPKIANWVLRLPTAPFRKLWEYRNRWDAELHVVKRMMADNMRYWKGWDLLKNISTPTLVVTGERDNYFPRWVFEDVGTTVPGAEIYDVGSAKHKVQLERHQAVNRAIERFIGGAGPRSWRGRATANPMAVRPWTKAYSASTPTSIPIPQRPVTAFLEQAAIWVPRRTATNFFGNKLSYQQLYARVKQFAHVLHGMGIGHGDRIMLILPNMPQLIVAYYGALSVGAVVVMSNPDADAAQIVQQAQISGSRVLVTLNSFGRLAQSIKANTGVEHVVFADIADNVSRVVLQLLLGKWGISAENSPPHNAAIGRRMSELMQDAPSAEPPPVTVSSADLATIIFTSGTTGDPKGVCLSHGNLVANALQTRHWFPTLKYAKESVMAVIPLIHSYGMTNAMNLPIMTAATMILLPVFDVKLVLEQVKKYKPTLFPGVPSMYMAINQTPNVRKYGMSSLTACLSGAAPLPVEVQEAFEKLTLGRLVEGYGLTEASPVTHANPLDGVRHPGSIGVPIPNTEARIVDLATGLPLPTGQIGELEVRGPQVMQGYWQPDGTLDRSSLTEDGWLKTGDVAVSDADGYFQIVSRKKDTIVFGEYSVYPRDVEEVIYENNKVLEVAVVGVDTPDGEQKVKAFVVPRLGTTLTVEELLDLCRRRLEPYAVPWEIEFRKDLPKSFIGKVLRRMLMKNDDSRQK
ncbi:MAG: alpha/beta fold hydrolase, partial [Candidatus Promineifilaceae bacterium]